MITRLQCDHFEIYRNIKSLCCIPGTVSQLYFNNKKTSKFVGKEIRCVFTRSRGEGERGIALGPWVAGEGKGSRGAHEVSGVLNLGDWQAGPNLVGGAGRRAKGRPDLFSSPFLEHLAPGFPPGGSERQRPPPPPQLLPHPTMR